MRHAHGPVLHGSQTRSRHRQTLHFSVFLSNPSCLRLPAMAITCSAHRQDRMGMDQICTGSCLTGRMVESRFPRSRKLVARCAAHLRGACSPILADHACCFAGWPAHGNGASCWWFWQLQRLAGEYVDMPDSYLQKTALIWINITNNIHDIMVNTMLAPVIAVCSPRA